MESASGKDSVAAAANEEVCCSRSAAGVVALGLAAAWLAAGSGGMLGQGLQRALMWLLFGTILVLGWPHGYRWGKSWSILAGAVVAAGAMTASSISVVNILAVVVILTGLAYLRDGIDSRAMLVGAAAVFLFATYRLAFCSLPLVWHLAQTAGAGLGNLVSLLTGQKLTIGATFAGIDFWVLMLFLAAGWGFSLAKPRWSSLLRAVAAVSAAEFAYLFLLAYSEKLLAWLPEPFFPVETDTANIGINNVGVWAWQNMVRAWLPWNLPMVALVFEAIVAGAMMRWARWMPITGGRTFLPGRMETGRNARPPGKKNHPGTKFEVISLGTLGRQLMISWGPAVLAALLAVNCTLSLGKTDLTGKTIFALEKGSFSWSLPEYGKSFENGYGLLPYFVESLGGKFTRVKNLADADLSSADLLLILQPDVPLSEKDTARLTEYVNSGGRLLLGAEKGGRTIFTQNSSAPIFSCCRDDTVVPLVEDWEQSYELFNTPATLGFRDARNPFGFHQGVTLDLGWSARPLIAGRWGWSEPGSAVAEGAAPQWELWKPLGDLVLAAEQSVGQGFSPGGRIVVLGDPRCLSNDVLPTSYEFVGRLLSVLADHETSDPATPWRQSLSLLEWLLLAAILLSRPRFLSLTAAAIALAVGIETCSLLSFHSRRVLPQSEGPKTMPLACIDASHLEAYSSRLWNLAPEREGATRSDYGIAGFARTLIRNGYLPLRLPEVTPERIRTAKILISIAPARTFSAKEREAVQQFVEQGGTLICLVGAEQARPSADLLGQFQFTVPPSPVPPGETIREPEPLGALRMNYFVTKGGSKDQVQFYAAWPVISENPQFTKYIYLTEQEEERLIVVSRRVNNGTIAVLADTYFATNQNLETLLNDSPENLRFWRWLLPQITGRGSPPPETEPPLEEPSEKEPDEG